MHNHPIDPIRFPKVQSKLEEEIKKNFEFTLKTMIAEIIKVLENKKR